MNVQCFTSVRYRSLATTKARSERAFRVNPSVYVWGAQRQSSQSGPAPLQTAFFLAHRFSRLHKMSSFHTRFAAIARCCFAYPMLLRLRVENTRMKPSKSCESVYILFHSPAHPTPKFKPSRSFFIVTQILKLVLSVHRGFSELQGTLGFLAGAKNNSCSLSWSLNYISLSYL